MSVAVIGGGIAGLAAAWELTAGPDPAEVTVIDPGPLGGRIQTEPFLGHPVDTGADAFIARVPDAVELAAELGLTDELVAPAARRALLWVGGRLRPLPEGLVLGAPARLGPVAASGILSPMGLLRAGLDLVLPPTPPTGDVSVAELVGRRFGRQVAERLVDPLVGGIHAGRTEELSAEATVPQLLGAARSRRSLLLALRALPAPPAGPVFLAPRGGMGRLIERLVEGLRARGVRFEPVAATALRLGKGGPVDVEPVGSFHAAVVAAPAPVAVRLLSTALPEVAAGLDSIRWSSVALATLAYRQAEFRVPDGVSGWLVARAEQRLMTACSFGSAKWPHWSDPATMVVRVSAGRSGDDRAVNLKDEELIDRLQHEVAAALATTAEPFAGRVVRWRSAFPQYDVGHRERIERLEAQLPANVALAGSSLRGSGIPACVASGRRAARLVREPASGT